MFRPRRRLLVSRGNASFVAAAFIALAFVSAIPTTAAPLSSSFTEVVPTPGQSALALSDYRIGPQDALAIVVFQVEDLSKTVRVDTSGTILLPLIGEMTASGRTTQQLSDDLAGELGKKYMNDPLVTVTLKESASQKVTIDGAVIQPGIYPISGETTLLQAIALAQGPGELADLHQVAIFRNSGTQRTSAVRDRKSVV